MTAIKRFITDAEARWQNQDPLKLTLVRANQHWVVFLDANGSEYTVALERFLLDPKVWQAVGAVRGWGDEDKGHSTKCDCGGVLHRMLDAHKNDCARVKAKRGYKFYQHRFLDHLQAGKSIEESLAALE